MKILATTAMALALTAISGCAQAGDMDRKEVEKIVKEYIMENPQIIQEALYELDRLDREKEIQDTKDAIVAAKDVLKNDPRDMSVGPKDAKVTIVEFFDYNCSACKASSDWLRGVMDDYPDDVRIVFKELPILEGRTKTSKNAAKAALAAGKQGKYPMFHFSLMAERSLTPDRVNLLAEKAGLDMDKFKKDMADPALDRQIQDAFIVSSQFPAFTGTPFFVINDDYVLGANIPKLNKMLKDQLEDS